MLKSKGIQFQVSRNPEVKCYIIERAQRTIRERLYTFFTYSNSNRYIDVLQKYVNAYNDSVHTATGMAPSKVTDSDVRPIWKKINKKIRRVRTTEAKFTVGQNVRISKEKMKFTKGAEENFSRQIFRINKVIKRIPIPV